MKHQFKIGLCNSQGDIFEVCHATLAELDNLTIQVNILTGGEWGWVCVKNIPVGKYEYGFEKMNPDWNDTNFNSPPYPRTETCILTDIKAGTRFERVRGHYQRIRRYWVRSSAKPDNEGLFQCLEIEYGERTDRGTWLPKDTVIYPLSDEETGKAITGMHHFM